MIYKIDYSEGLKHRTKIPRHAILIKWTEKSKGRCFAFFDSKTNKPINATLKPINEMFAISKGNYKVEILN